MISFIVTAFNRPLALRTCLSSLIQQTNQEWEAIVVDNSDLYEARERQEYICKIDDRVRYLYTGSSTGIQDAMHARSLYAATEIGVELAKGDFVCLPNDDSYYCPWFAERMTKAACKEQWDLVYCDIVMGGPGGHHLLEASPRPCCIDKTNFLLRRSWFQGFSQGHGDSYPQADGLMIEELVRRGIRHGRVPEILAVHN